MKTKRSEELFERAKRSIPGGVNSPVRAFKAVGGTPRFIRKGEGSKIFDEDGNEYLDFVCSWGPLLFGHNPPFVKEAIARALERGSSFGAPVDLEIEMAELIKSLVPSIELVRMTNSGTEALMSAVRLARGFTGRNKIIKFEGCYHGHADSFLIKAGSGAASFGVPTSPGVPPGVAADTLAAKYNDITSVERLFDENKGKIAAVVIEPVAGNMGVIPAKKDFLSVLKNICEREGALLIFDEVITGFRLAPGGAQQLYSIEPDLSCFGKIIGGGLPVGAFGGKREIMEKISPLGPVYQAGTLSGNPLAMAAGTAALKKIAENPSIYDELENKAARLENKLKNNLKKLGLGFRVNRVGSMFCLFFLESEPLSFEDVSKCDVELYAKYFRESLNRGVCLPPSQFETSFVSLALSDEDIDFAAEVNYESLKRIFEQ